MFDKSLKIAILEDELLISEMLKEMLLELGHRVIGQAKNIEEAQKIVNGAEKPDLFFCDINLNELESGIDFGKTLRENHQIPFVYITSYSDKNTLEEAALTQPAAYILKPFIVNRIQATLIMLSAQLGLQSKQIVVKVGHEKLKLESKNILFIRSENNYLEIQTFSQKVVIRQSMDSFLDELDCDKIQRVHRSYAVNIDHVKRISSSQIILQNFEIPLSRKYKDQIKPLL